MSCFITYPSVGLILPTQDVLLPATRTIFSVLLLVETPQLARWVVAHFSFIM